MSKREQIKILKVRFDKLTLAQATDLAMSMAKNHQGQYISTPNPEILLEAQKNRKFLKILNHSALNIPDGAGILWAARYLDQTENTHNAAIKIFKWLTSIISVPFSNTKVLPERVTGADLMEEICKRAATQDLRIFLLGAKEGVAEKVRKNLETIYKGLHIIDTCAGSPRPEDEAEIIKRINSSEADILFVAFGAPKQEMWISKNLSRLRTVKLAIGVGGAFDFIAKEKKRAPKWMQKTGLEWLFRLIQEPSRFRRIYRATIKFPLTVLKQRLKN